MKKVLFVAGSGGHTAQLSILLKQLGDRYDSEVMLENTDQLGIKKFAEKYKIYTASVIRGKSEPLICTFFRILMNTFQAIVILLRSNPDVIITTGPGLGIPICVVGKVIGKKIVLIESWSRTSSKSFVGKALSSFSDLFFVQWPAMVQYYPKAKFAGRFS